MIPLLLLVYAIGVLTGWITYFLTGLLLLLAACCRAAEEPEREQPRALYVLLPPEVSDRAFEQEISRWLAELGIDAPDLSTERKNPQ